jgi:hypothetical protein
MMEGEHFTATLITTYQTIRIHISEGHNLNTLNCEHLYLTQVHNRFVANICTIKNIKIKGSSLFYSFMLKNEMYLTSPTIILRSIAIVLCGETLSSNPGRSTVRAQSSFSSSL